MESPTRWYRGRATHIHVKVHVGATVTNIGGAIYRKGGHVSHTGQLFVNDTLTDVVAKLSPYVLQKTRQIRNNEDSIYSQSKGSTIIVSIQFLTANSVKGAPKGGITLSINPKAVSIQNERPGGGPPRPPPGGRPPPGR
ncbi:unnamed protein product [Rotaria magnacalcarata]|uniref:Uncharacterized protein n=2 Tax=Rotaria magnacalcarata TaxID=392030 RepID=A0A816RI31_9BILA|nr:unnamed protein product [Rotaria magnacalcarata]